MLDGDGKRERGMDHERSGELVLLSDTRSWFTYYWWEDDGRAPDYARTVNIHAKPGYDPCELFLDPALRLPRLKIGAALLKKRLGFRSLLEVVPLDATLVKGSHGRPTDDPAAGPILMTTHPGLLDDGSVAATEVYRLLLRHLMAP